MYTFPIVAKVAVKLTRSNLDNVVDRAHYFFTFAVLVVAALINACELLFGSPIQCMAPAEYESGWVNFVNEYCFINGTYVTPGGGFKPSPSSTDKIDVTYYQVGRICWYSLFLFPANSYVFKWFGYVLFLQCLMFYAPHFIWSSLQTLTGESSHSVFPNHHLLNNFRF